LYTLFFSCFAFCSGTKFYLLFPLFLKVERGMVG
jgi:hypothetical protein